MKRVDDAEFAWFWIRSATLLWLFAIMVAIAVDHMEDRTPMVLVTAIFAIGAAGVYAYLAAMKTQQRRHFWGDHEGRLRELIKQVGELVKAESHNRLGWAAHAVSLDKARKEMDRADKEAARVKQLEERIRWAHGRLMEINVGNYDHDDVCALNAASVEVILRLAADLPAADGAPLEMAR